jgi:hypothetical protein
MIGIFCKEHHLIETFFAKLKQFSAIATRYDKTTRNFLAAVYLTASAILLNWRHVLAKAANSVQYGGSVRGFPQWTAHRYAGA